jgi:hypothetical protein
VADALIATAGSASANTYATLARARTYYGNTPGAEDTDGVDDDTALAQALITATGLIDDKFTFAGTPTSTTQALAWPRTGLTTKSGGALSSTTIPRALEDATAELARQLLKNTKLADANNDLAGVTRIKAGRAFEIEFADSANLSPTVIPDNVARMLARWGARVGKTGVLKLIRA